MTDPRYIKPMEKLHIFRNSYEYPENSKNIKRLNTKINTF